MADEGDPPAHPAVALDPSGKRLQLDAEKAKYAEAIAKAQQGVAEAKAASLKSVLPTVVDAPKGEVTLGEKAGAFGPWRAHQIVDALAKQIATQVKKTLAEQEARVLVVDDRSLVQSDWTARHVRHTLERLARRIDALHTQVLEGTDALADGIRVSAADEVEPAPTGPRKARSDAPPPAAEEATPGVAPVGVPGALGAAIDMLGLLRTDYTLTASAVTPGPAELVTLTAGHLAAAGLTVEADAFSTVRASPSTRQLTSLLDARDDTVKDLAELQSSLAPVEAELAGIATRAAIVEEEWAKAVTDETGKLKSGALRQAADDLARLARRREKAAGPARTLVTYAQQVVADVDAAVITLLQAPEGGEAPLFTAARRERLEARDDAQDIVTHVLYITLDAVAADAVTRRSILGTSGLLRFLAAGNASWLLLESATGTIDSGGQQSLADVMTFSLEDGTATYSDTPELQRATEALKDSHSALESNAKLLVVVLAVVLVIFGLLSILAVIRVILA